MNKSTDSNLKEKSGKLENNFFPLLLAGITELKESHSGFFYIYSFYSAFLKHMFLAVLLPSMKLQIVYYH